MAEQYSKPDLIQVIRILVFPLGQDASTQKATPFLPPPPIFSIVLGFLLEFVGIHFTEKRHCKRKESSPGTCKPDNDITRVKTWTWRSRASHTNY